MKYLNSAAEFKKFVGKDFLQKMKDLGYDCKTPFRTWKSLEDYVSAKVVLFHEGVNVHETESMLMKARSEAESSHQMLGRALEQILNAKDEISCMNARSSAFIVLQYLASPREADDLDFLLRAMQGLDQSPILMYSPEGVIRVSFTGTGRGRMISDMGETRDFVLSFDGKKEMAFGPEESHLVTDILLDVDGARTKALEKMAESRQLLDQVSEAGNLPAIHKYLSSEYLLSDGRFFLVEEVGDKALYIDGDNVGLAKIPPENMSFFLSDVKILPEYTMKIMGDEETPAPGM